MKNLDNLIYKSYDNKSKNSYRVRLPMKEPGANNVSYKNIYFA